MTFNNGKLFAEKQARIAWSGSSELKQELVTSLLFQLADHYLTILV
jgi:hypothetical protein